MRAALLACVLALAWAAPAAADLLVQDSRNSSLVARHSGDTAVRAALESFTTPQDGVRLRRLGPADQPITTDAEQCTATVAADAVECLFLPVLIRLQGSDLPDELLIGSEGQPCRGVARGEQTHVSIRLGDGDDRLSSTNTCPGVDDFLFSVRAEGGAGADVMSGGPLFDDFFGGPGDDLLIGGVDSDTLVGNTGSDVLRGGPAGDRFSEAGPAEPDVISGGGGQDRLRYSRKTGGPLSVTVDGVANDGAPGEMDNVTSIESFESNGDTDDTFIGDAGSGSVETGRGDDVVRPGGGKDAVAAGVGDDVIDLLDREKDFLNCGPGYDEAIADRREEVLTRYGPGDRFDRGCERLLRYAEADGPPAQVVERELVLRGSRLSLRLRCPGGGGRCQGRLSVYDPRYDDDRFGSFQTNPFTKEETVYARARYSLTAGATERLSLTLSRGGVAVARARGLATYAVEQGGQPRTALNLLAR